MIRYCNSFNSYINSIVVLILKFYICLCQVDEAVLDLRSIARKEDLNHLTSIVMSRQRI